MKKLILFALMLSACVTSLPASPVKSMLGAWETKNIGCNALPDGVVAVEYIEMTGTQYIDTGYHATPQSEFFCGITPITHRINGMSFWGASKGDGTSGLYDSVYLCDRYGYTGQMHFVDSYNNKNNIAFSYGDFLSVECIVSNGCLSVNGMANSYKAWVLNGTALYPIYIGSTNLSGSPFRNAAARYHYWGVRENGRVVMEMIPVRVDVDGEIEGAFYDIISGELFYNLGTGSLILGPDKEVE